MYVTPAEEAIMQGRENLFRLARHCRKAEHFKSHTLEPRRRLFRLLARPMSPLIRKCYTISFVWELLVACPFSSAGCPGGFHCGLGSWEARELRNCKARYHAIPSQVALLNFFSLAAPCGC